MYCIKCGRAIASGNLCIECATPAVTYAPPVKPPYGDPSNKKAGFGNALAGTITGIIGFLFTYIGFLLAFIEGDESSIVLMVMGLGLGIVGLVLGISSIKVFSLFKNARPKPVATLVLGIVGLASGALALHMALCGIIIAGSIF